ncbi:helix-turn-helix transcriptional regulator [Yoonia sp. SS1-5]|uniref:Helix-turn-helix transcriptional regulator n=1 Tax=Yoonia rhodophyticola TaxID=3137370 RepID=A0AAN0M7S8_9RHOB
MTGFPNSLKSWRKARRLSQLDLALEADVSGRHVSFLETGRAQPSREMVMRLGEALQMPLEARNHMLTQAGFAARYGGRDWSDTEMNPIRRAVERMLTCHMPFPGIAVDRLWTIRQANEAARALFGMFGVGVGDSLLALMTSDVLPPVIENWPEVAHHAAARLRVESMAQGGVPELDQAAAALAQVGGHTGGDAGPVIPTIFNAGDTRLSLFATIAQFGTPDDITLDDLKIELYYPMDDDTAAALEALGQA